jgi:CubicO group peptidase (beta-lactamase class C family)
VFSLLLAALALQGIPAALDRAVERGIADGVFPGAVVVIGTADRILASRGYGHLTWSANSPVPDPATTIWDLASLTKVTATLPAALLLIARGAIDLDAPVMRYLPDFAGAGRDAVTVRHLLTHRSGLRAFLPLDRETTTADEARARVMAEPLRWPVDARTEYSDLNAILLGWVVEAAAGEPLDVFVRREVHEPLGMIDTRYRPARALRDRIAPVGNWRGTPVAGEVHDQNAARLGGVAGHAGLFATGADLARYAQFWLGGGALLPDSLRRAAYRRGPNNRALGWEMRDTTTTDNTGQRFSAATFGHTGYTGTSLWIDPARGLFVLLLTNRVYAPRHGRSITALKAVRGAVADAAASLAMVCLAGNDAGRATLGC